MQLDARVPTMGPAGRQAYRPARARTRIVACVVACIVPLLALSLLASSRMRRVDPIVERTMLVRLLPDMPVQTARQAEPRPAVAKMHRPMRAAVHPTVQVVVPVAPMVVVPQAEAPAAATPLLDPETLHAEIRQNLRKEARKRAQPPAYLRAEQPEPKSKLGRDIEQAIRPDCQTAYAGAGLLAVVPLVIDAVRDKGCKW